MLIEGNVDRLGDALQGARRACEEPLDLPPVAGDLRQTLVVSDDLSPGLYETILDATLVRGPPPSRCRCWPP